ncbi:MAG: type II toxin-antitoxin system Phd/YefM family antitoxin [Geminicoccaceae bacterium]
MAVTVDLDDEKADLSTLIERVRLGEEIVITEAGEPVARLVAEHSRKPRRPGSAKGQFVMHDSFDDPLPDDLLDLFEGKGDRLLGD